MGRAASLPSRARGSESSLYHVRERQFDPALGRLTSRDVMDHATHKPATGVTIFAWGSLREQPEKVEELGKLYRSVTP